MNFKYPLKLFLIAMIVAGLGGCESNKSVVGGFLDLDTDLKINFIVAADINSDEQGVASPLFLRMYQLKSDRIMKKAEFIDLYEKDSQTLGADMIDKPSNLKRFKPGENRTQVFVLDPETQFVAFFAEFRDFKNAQFKLVVPVVLNNVVRNSVVIDISGNTMSLYE